MKAKKEIERQSRPPPGTKFIYGLIDPRDSSIRYVGETEVSLATRLSGHWSDSWIRHHGGPLGTGAKRIAWLNELRQQGLKPTIKLLDTVSSDDRNAERRWVKKLLSEGQPLTNGHYVPNPDGLKLISRSLVCKAIERLRHHGENTIADQLEVEVERLWSEAGRVSGEP